MIEIAVAALIAGLSLLAEHWFPWRLLLGHRLPRLVAYVIGSLAILLPLSGVYVVWIVCPERRWSGMELIALWAVFGAGGLAVLIAYFVDWVMRLKAHKEDMHELMIREKRDETGRVDC